MIKLNYLSVKDANLIREVLEEKVIPSENRILVYSPGDEEVVSGSLIIPGNVKEGKPRKGVVILSGVMDEGHENYYPLVQTGLIITYGIYAGKEVEFNEYDSFPQEFKELTQNGKFTILDTNEVIMAEANN